MQLMALHDIGGNIVGLVVSQPDMPLAQVTTDAHPGARTTEVEVPEGVTLDLDSRQLSEVLENLKENYLVDIPTVKGKLKRKPDASAEQSSVY